MVEGPLEREKRVDPLGREDRLPSEKREPLGKEDWRPREERDPPEREDPLLREERRPKTENIEEESFLDKAKMKLEGL